MKIETKFEIGQIVYYVGFKYIKQTCECRACEGKGKVTLNMFTVGCPVCQGSKLEILSSKRDGIVKKDIIKAIQADVDSDNEISVEYDLTDNSCFNEIHLYASVEEAEQEIKIMESEE